MPSAHLGQVLPVPTHVQIHLTAHHTTHHAQSHARGALSDSGYTHRIGSVNAYDGSSSYRTYNNNDSWNGGWYQQPSSSSRDYYDWNWGSLSSGYNRIGYVNPYASYSNDWISSYDYYSSSGGWGGYYDSYYY